MSDRKISIVDSAARFAVPYIFCGGQSRLENIDRCTALGSLLPPPPGSAITSLYAFVTNIYESWFCVSTLLRCPAVPSRSEVRSPLADRGTLCTLAPPAAYQALGSAARFAVPEEIIGLTLFLDFFDRCTALPSLLPPPAAVGSLTQRATLADLITRK